MLKNSVKRILIPSSFLNINNKYKIVYLQMELVLLPGYNSIYGTKHPPDLILIKSTVSTDE